MFPSLWLLNPFWQSQWETYPAGILFFSWQLYYRFDKAHLQLKGILFCHFSPGMWDSLVVGRVFEKKMTSPVSKVFKLIRCCWCCCPCNNSISQSYILIVDISVVNDARSGWPFLCFGFLLPSISVTVFFLAFFKHHLVLVGFYQKKKSEK